MEKHRRRNRSGQTVFFSVILGILLLTTIAFLFISGWRVNRERAQIEAKLKTLRENIQALEEKNQALKQELPQAQTQDYLEKKLREQGYQKPGEEAVVVLPPEGESTESKTQIMSSWQKFLSIIKFW